MFPLFDKDQKSDSTGAAGAAACCRPTGLMDGGICCPLCPGITKLGGRIGLYEYCSGYTYAHISNW
jgi:hypothetical protein